MRQIIAHSFVTAQCTPKSHEFPFQYLPRNGKADENNLIESVVIRRKEKVRFLVLQRTIMNGFAPTKNGQILYSFKIDGSQRNKGRLKKLFLKHLTIPRAT